MENKKNIKLTPEAPRNKISFEDQQRVRATSFKTLASKQKQRAEEEDKREDDRPELLPPTRILDIRRQVEKIQQFFALKTV